MTRKITFIIIAVIPCLTGFNIWGFFAHQKINELAIFSLPPEMFAFYKRNVIYITENAVNPDKRRYAVKSEGPKHYIDLDMYHKNNANRPPKYWNMAIEKYGIDSLLAKGIAPWHIQLMKQLLTKAFQEKNPKDILKYSTEIGHYLADIHVPLHTTSNYNGQLTNQHGIHGFWESRLPELFSKDYDFFVGKAIYINDTQETVWDIVMRSNEMVDSVLNIEKQLTIEFPPDKKYSFEERNGRLVKVYSKAFSTAYHNKLSGMVERRMRSSVHMISSFWYTCWVDAGQPNLDDLLDFKFSEEEIKIFQQESLKWQNKIYRGRDHEALEN
ncbi:zinc dependent phospholipase C family protein [Fulvivirgaceae bacterium BMA10]|uniref:Zinc dependent phospholipase C family protein n=1 Tax=Splendidivirga corallicola TaxID=3051826 RepID=A0ABT8KK29_9BACT|nr:zinc dependent phospholipase C family protein [Fulvivirgaceae bacterium BMA10]